MFRVCKNINIYSSRLSIRSFGGNFRPNVSQSVEKLPFLQRLYNQVPRGFKKYFPEGKGGSTPKENSSTGAAKEKPSEAPKSEHGTGSKESPKEHTGTKQSDSKQSESSSNAGAGKARMAGGAGKGNTPKMPGGGQTGGILAALSASAVVLLLLTNGRKDGK